MNSRLRSSTGPRLTFVDPSILYCSTNDSVTVGPPNSTSASAGSDDDGFSRAARYAAMLFYLVCIIAARRSRRNHNMGMTYACLFYRRQGLPGSLIALQEDMNRKTVIRRSNNLRAWLDPSGNPDLVADAEESVDAHETMLSAGDRSCEILSDFASRLAHVCAEWARGDRDALLDLLPLVDPIRSGRRVRKAHVADRHSQSRASRALCRRLGNLLGDHRSVDFVVEVLRSMAASRKEACT